MEWGINLKPTNTIQNKLIGAFIVTTFLVSSLYGVLVYNAMKYTEDDILDTRLVLESTYFIQQYSLTGVNARLPQSNGLVSYLSSSPALPQWLAEQPVGRRELHDREVHIAIVDIPSSTEKLYLSLSETQASSLEEELSTLLMVLLFIGAVITVLGLGLGLIFSKAISTPIALLTGDVKNTQRDHTQTFYGADRHDEVGELSRSFSAVVMRINGFLEREKQFTRYVSHELRTPISLIKNALAVLCLPEQNDERKERNLARIESAVLELESLVTTFLALGREGTQLKQTQIDFAEVLSNNLARNQVIFNNRRFDIEVIELNTVSNFSANHALIDILVDNIIRNIYAHGGSRASITLDSHKVTFENDVLDTNLAEINNQSMSCGMGIINTIADALGITINYQLGAGSFKTTLELNDNAK